MAVTRLIVEATDPHQDHPGVLGDINSLIELLANHDEDMEGLENTSGDNNHDPEVVTEIYPERADNVVGHLPQVCRTPNNAP